MSGGAGFPLFFQALSTLANHECRICRMLDLSDIPEALKGQYKKIIQAAPLECRNDPRLRETTLVYLKFGGEKLARHYIELFKLRLCDQTETEETDADIDAGMEEDEAEDMDDDLDDPEEDHRVSDPT